MFWLKGVPTKKSLKFFRISKESSPWSSRRFLELYDFSEEADTIDVVHPSEFLPGMEINQDLYLPDETLIAPKGTIVEKHFMRIIENYYATYHGGNPFPEKVQVVLRKKK